MVKNVIQKIRLALILYVVICRTSYYYVKLSWMPEKNSIMIYQLEARVGTDSLLCIIKVFLAYVNTNKGLQTIFEIRTQKIQYQFSATAHIQNRYFPSNALCVVKKVFRALNQHFPFSGNILHFVYNSALSLYVKSADNLPG